MKRDFTYIDDVVEGLVAIQNVIPGENSGLAKESEFARIYNIGNSQQVDLEDLISCIENHLNVVAKKVYMPMQDGDVVHTYSDSSKLNEVVSFRPATSISEGMGRFIGWYADYAKVPEATAALECETD